MKEEAQQLLTGNRAPLQTGNRPSQFGRGQKHSYVEHERVNPAQSSPLAPNLQGRGQGRGRGTMKNTAGTSHTSSQFVGNRIICYKCGLEGHKSSDCRRAASNLLVDGQEIEATKEEAQNNEVNGDEGLLDFTEQEVTYEDQNLPSLVIRGAMLTPKVNEANWQRKNLFRTRCSFEGRLCNLIIDGGGCENLVSKEMVTKLNFKVQLHPQPYRIE